MRHLMVLTTSMFLVVASGAAAGGPFSPAGISRADSDAPVILVQDRTRHESLKQKVKRVWRNLTGYKFEVSCPLNRTTCTDTGKDRGEAQAKCISRNPFCWVADAK